MLDPEGRDGKGQATDNKTKTSARCSKENIKSKRDGTAGVAFIIHMPVNIQLCTLHYNYLERGRERERGPFKRHI